MTNSGREQRPKRGSPLPGTVFLSIALGIGLLISLLPRTGDQPPPPTIAEFAPQAARQIRKALSLQTSQFGSDRGGCVEGQVCTGGVKPPSPAPRPTIEVPLAKQCYGDRARPETLRQAADYQSPPCIPYWKGNNGGGTSKGVTGDSIFVAVPTVAFENADNIQPLADFFNRHFQFYGRKIVLKQFPAKGNLNSQPSPDLELTDAKRVDEELKAFASLTTGGRFGSEHLYYDELARRKIISVAHRAGTKTSEAYLQRFAPYRWSVLPGIDTMQRHMAEMVCKVLAGKAPEYAGPGVTGNRRVFGLIYGRAADGTKPDLDLFRNDLSACKVSLAADVEYDQSGDQTTDTGTILKMVQARVTSVICFCDVSALSSKLMQAASGEQYRPEWILSTYIDNDVDNSFAQAPPDQATHVIGASFRNKWLPREDMFWYRAWRDAFPAGDPQPNEGYSLAARYSSLLLLASGIQMAGPILTPKTFEEGLLRAQFPNPFAQGPPYYQARVGFEGGRHTMIGDATMYWYSRSERGTVDPTSFGAVCYVDQGRRYSLGAWPQQEPAFQRSCRGG